MGGQAHRLLDLSRSVTSSGRRVVSAPDGLNHVPEVEPAGQQVLITHDTERRICGEREAHRGRHDAMRPRRIQSGRCYGTPASQRPRDYPTPPRAPTPHTKDEQARAR